MRAERASKIAVAAWAVLAVVVESYYASPGWAALRLIAPLLVGAMALASMADRRTVAVVAAAPYAFPLALYLTTGQYHVHYTTAWLAAMLGVVLPDALKRPWHVPGRWAAALACWAGVVAITAPIVMLRAVDLRWELLTRSRLPYEALGGLTFQSLGWTGHVALLIVVGILWFDWLYSLEEGFFLRWVIAPFAGSAVLMAATSAYQMAFDINAVNPTVYARLLRATGTLFDANVAGAAAAFWTGVIVLFGLHRFGRRWWAVLPVVPLFWVAVWGSGSRTAFLAAVLTTGAAVFAATRQMRLHARTVVAAAGAGVVLVAALVAILWAVSPKLTTDPRVLTAPGTRPTVQVPSVVGPLARFQNMVDRGQMASPKALFTALWERDGYGLGANLMIAAYPGFGVGIGAFHEMVPDFAGSLPADNAQNWFRHQLAETGVIGSLGWIAFVLPFGWCVLRPRRDEHPGAWAARGVIVVFTGMSLVSVPGQDPAIAVTFWTLAAWYLLLVGRPNAAPAPRWAWGAALIVVLAAGAGTARLAAGPLRVPVRIQHTLSGDYTEYAYGVFGLELDGEGEFRWTGQRSTQVVPATGRRIVVTAGVNFGDLAEHPTRAKVWVNGRLLIDGVLTADARTITETLPLDASLPRALVETWVERTETAPPPDGRELGLMLRTRFE